ncbi:MAG: methyltransferase domain-containing protein [Eubacteriales bacterium]
MEASTLQVEEDLRIRKEMEKIVPTYDAYMRKITLGRERILRERTITLAGIKPGEAVLEVGCGTGTLTLAAKRRAGLSGKVCGIDLIPGMIEISRQKAEEASQDILFQEGSIENIPFPDNQFDVVMCSFMIFHMSDGVRSKGIQEIFRVLKPEGRLLLIDLTLPPYPVSRFIAKRILSWVGQDDLHDLLPLLEACGFSGVEIAPVKFRIMGVSLLSYVRGNAKKK